jgi:hypothetical protein
MNEPLNHSPNDIWPEWHQKPIRLTVQEIENPIIVIEQFFQCFHLPDIRECLKVWLQDAFTKDTIESKQHISTYNEVEKLVEAAWVIHNSFSGSRLRKLQRNWIYAGDNSENSTQKDRYKKKELLIERVSQNPTGAIGEVFLHNDIAEFLDLLSNWFRTALLNNRCRYTDNSMGREILSEFYDQLHLLIQALFVINEKGQSTNGELLSPEKLLEKYKRYDIPFLSKNQITDPTSVVVAFYEIFSIEYVRRELRDFLDAGVGYEGSYPNWFTPWQAFMAYEGITCLTEAAYHLCQQMTAKKSLK